MTDIRIVNDFSITFGTVNGSGSATANITLLRAIFKMGIPVSGKNIFPSNIQGQPTWYTIRINRDGFLARADKSEICVAMNPASIQKEYGNVPAGGVFLYADDLKLEMDRGDIIVYPMPVKRIINASNTPNHFKDYVANMVYVGILTVLLDIPLDKIYNALSFHFGGKEKGITSNYDIVKSSAAWAQDNIVKVDPYLLQSADLTNNMILTLGNTAGALGSIYGGVQFAAWYPITPATSLAESLNDYLPKLRKDPISGKNTFAIAQTEDEISAIGMTIGAGWAGLRSMTSTSGPGLSLMSEYLGLAYYSEIPVVVWDVQRVGPSTGMPTRTAQGDITQAYFISHGDRQFIILIPGSVNECFEFGWKSFDIAEKFQTPVIVLSDLDLGMNHWMTAAFAYPDQPMDRGRILWEKDLEALLTKTGGKWGRYLDIDGDGIPYRTVAGNKHPKAAYMGRGTSHDEFARYSEDGPTWEKLMDRLQRKLDGVKQKLPPPVIIKKDNAENGIICCGSSDLAVREAIHKLEQENRNFDFMRIRGIPFSEEVHEFIRDHKKSYVVELNRDGQLRQLLILDNPECSTKLLKITSNDGLPITADRIIKLINAQEVN